MQKLEAEAMENGAYLFVPRLTLSYMSQAYLLRNATSYCGFTSTINQKNCPTGMHTDQCDGAGSGMHTGPCDGASSYIGASSF